MSLAVEFFSLSFFVFVVVIALIVRRIFRVALRYGESRVTAVFVVMLAVMVLVFFDRMVFAATLVLLFAPVVLAIGVFGAATDLGRGSKTGEATADFGSRIRMVRQDLMAVGLPADVLSVPRRPSRFTAAAVVTSIVASGWLAITSVGVGDETAWRRHVRDWTDDNGAFEPQYRLLEIWFPILPGLAEWPWFVIGFVMPAVSLLAVFAVRWLWASDMHGGRVAIVAIGLFGLVLMWGSRRVAPVVAGETDSASFVAVDWRHLVASSLFLIVATALLLRTRLSHDQGRADTELAIATAECSSSTLIVGTPGESLVDSGFAEGAVRAGTEAEKETARIIDEWAIHYPGTVVWHSLELARLTKRTKKKYDVDHVIWRGDRIVVVDTKNWEADRYAVTAEGVFRNGKKTDYGRGTWSSAVPALTKQFGVPVSTCYAVTNPNTEISYDGTMCSVHQSQLSEWLTAAFSAHPVAWNRQATSALFRLGLDSPRQIRPSGHVGLGGSESTSPPDDSLRDRAVLAHLANRLDVLGRELAASPPSSVGSQAMIDTANRVGGSWMRPHDAVLSGVQGAPRELDAKQRKDLINLIVTIAHYWYAVAYQTFVATDPMLQDGFTTLVEQCGRYGTAAVLGPSQESPNMRLFMLLVGVDPRFDDATRATVIPEIAAVVSRYHQSPIADRTPEGEAALLSRAYRVLSGTARLRSIARLRRYQPKGFSADWWRSVCAQGTQTRSELLFADALVAADRRAERSRQLGGSDAVAMVLLTSVAIATIVYTTVSAVGADGVLPTPEASVAPSTTPVPEESEELIPTLSELVGLIGAERSTLGIGAQGGEVQFVQRALEAVLDIDWAPTGVFDLPTAQSVRELQSFFGVAPTGRVDDETWQLIDWVVSDHLAAG